MDETIWTNILDIFENTQSRVKVQLSFSSQSRESIMYN